MGSRGPDSKGVCYLTEFFSIVSVIQHVFTLLMLVRVNYKTQCKGLYAVSLEMSYININIRLSEESMTLRAGHSVVRLIQNVYNYNYPLLITTWIIGWRTKYTVIHNTTTISRHCIRNTNTNYRVST